MGKTGELSDRDKLFNAVLEAVKTHGAGMEIGLVRAVLGEVETGIGMLVNRKTLDCVYDKLEEIRAREC